MKAWNELNQAYELVDYSQATREIRDPQNPEKRKRLTGTDVTAQIAQKNLQRAET